MFTPRSPSSPWLSMDTVLMSRSVKRRKERSSIRDVGI